MANGLAEINELDEEAEKNCIELISLCDKITDKTIEDHFTKSWIYLKYLIKIASENNLGRVMNYCKECLKAAQNLENKIDSQAFDIYEVLIRFFTLGMKMSVMSPDEKMSLTDAFNASSLKELEEELSDESIKSSFFKVKQVKTLTSFKEKLKSFLEDELIVRFTNVFYDFQPELYKIMAGNSSATKIMREVTWDPTKVFPEKMLNAYKNERTNSFIPSETASVPALN